MNGGDSGEEVEQIPTSTSYKFNQTNSRQTTPTKKTTRYRLKCMEHHSSFCKYYNENIKEKYEWSEHNENCVECLDFRPAPLPSSTPPTLHAAICYCFRVKETLGLDSLESALADVTSDLVAHLDVYTKIRTSVKLQVTAHLAKFSYLKNYPKKTRRDIYWKEYKQFVEACNNTLGVVFDSEGFLNVCTA